MRIMTLEISVNHETETRMRQMAASAGKDVSAFVSQLVEQAAAKPSLDELLAPFGGSLLNRARPTKN